MFSQTCVTNSVNSGMCVGSMQSRGHACHRGHAWQGGLHGRGAHVTGGMHGRGCE